MKKKRKPISKEKLKRRKGGSARGISGYENFMIQQQNNENYKLKKSMK